MEHWKQHYQNERKNQFAFECFQRLILFLAQLQLYNWKKWTRRSIYRLWLYWLWFWCSECSLIALCCVLYKYSISASCVLSGCFLGALWVLTGCSLTPDWFLTDCLKIWARKMKIDCSRQVWTDRTEISISWAPIGAKKRTMRLHALYVLTVVSYKMRVSC